MTKIELVRDYFAFITNASSDSAEILEFVLPSCEWIEHPNAITPKTKVRNLSDTQKGAEAGKKLMAHQEITISSFFEAGDQLLVEGLWVGTVGAAVGKFVPGQVLRAFMAIVFTFRDGKIARQVNYDCYEAF